MLSPAEVIATHAKIGYNEFDAYARTCSFTDGPYREDPKNLEQENDGKPENDRRRYRVAFGVLRTGRKVFTEI